jgi:hypothetical protein
VDLDTLTNALSVLSAVGGRRTNLVPSQPGSSSTLRTPGLTRLPPRERHLQQRVGESGQGEDEARNFTREARESSGVSTGAQLRMEDQREAGEDFVPRTAARRNVTSRRSRGRQEGFGRDPQTLIAKKTRGRSRDREYIRESLGVRQQVGGPSLPGPVMLARCKTRMKGEMDYRTRNRVAQLMVSPPYGPTRCPIPGPTRPGITSYLPPAGYTHRRSGP